MTAKKGKSHALAARDRVLAKRRDSHALVLGIGLQLRGEIVMSFEGGSMKAGKFSSGAEQAAAWQTGAEHFRERCGMCRVPVKAGFGFWLVSKHEAGGEKGKVIHF